MQGTLAIHPGALGDVVLFGRLLETLAAHPVTLISGGEKARLLQGLGVVERVLDFDLLPMHQLYIDAPLAQSPLARQLGPHSSVISCMDGQGVDRRLIDLTGCRSVHFLPVRPPEDFAGHLLDLWRQRLQDDLTSSPCKGLPASFSAWPVLPEWREQGQSLLRSAGLDPARPFALMHVGAGALQKCWPLENFLELGLCLTKQSVQVALLAGPAEMERLAPQMEQASARLPMIKSPPLEAITGMLSICTFYIGNDSGVSHLSAAVGAKTIAMFGPSRSKHFAPLGPSVHVVQEQSMANITVMDMLETINQRTL